MSEAFTRSELIACVEREVKLRKQVYPLWVKIKRMSAAKAEHELGCMQAVLAALLDASAEEKP